MCLPDIVKRTIACNDNMQMHALASVIGNLKGISNPNLDTGTIESFVRLKVAVLIVLQELALISPHYSELYRLFWIPMCLEVLLPLGVSKNTCWTSFGGLCCLALTFGWTQNSSVESPYVPLMIDSPPHGLPKTLPYIIHDILMNTWLCDLDLNIWGHRMEGSNGRHILVSCQTFVPTIGPNSVAYGTPGYNMTLLHTPLKRSRLIGNDNSPPTNWGTSPSCSQILPWDSLKCVLWCLLPHKSDQWHEDLIVDHQPGFHSQKFDDCTHDAKDLEGFEAVFDLHCLLRGQREAWQQVKNWNRPAMQSWRIKSGHFPAAFLRLYPVKDASFSKPCERWTKSRNGIFIC